MIQEFEHLVCLNCLKDDQSNLAAIPRRWGVEYSKHELIDLGKSSYISEDQTASRIVHPKHCYDGRRCSNEPLHARWAEGVSIERIWAILQFLEIGAEFFSANDCRILALLNA